MTIALILVSLLLAGAGVWAGVMMVQRAKAAAEIAGLSARLNEAERQREENASKLAHQEQRWREANEEVGRLREKIADLNAQIRAQIEQTRQNEQARLELHEQEIANVEATYRERFDAAKREKELVEKKLAEMGEQMQAKFGALAADALKQSTSEFLKLAGERFAAREQSAVNEMDKRREAVERLVGPISETLKKTDEKLAAMESARVAGSAQLLEQVKQVGSAGNELRIETARLVKALREPQVRGRYGEIQLKRVAELAGMRSYCDFVEQESTVDGDGNIKRPDMVVRLPNGRELVVDAKANLKPYLDAMEATTPEEADGHLQRFADGLLKQATQLGRKEYYKEYEGSPDFVVMFVPGDQFVDAALSKRPEILELAAGDRVLLASPSTLIAMLRAVAVGFAEQKLTEEARSIKTLATELHERAATMLEYLATLGKGIESVVERYNKLTGSVEGRLMPTLRKLEEKEVKSGKKIEEIKEVVVKARMIEGRVMNE